MSFQEPAEVKRLTKTEKRQAKNAILAESDLVAFYKAFFIDDYDYAPNKVVIYEGDGDGAVYGLTARQFFKLFEPV